MIIYLFIRVNAILFMAEVNSRCFQAAMLVLLYMGTNMVFSYYTMLSKFVWKHLTDNTSTEYCTNPRLAADKQNI